MNTSTFDLPSPIRVVFALLPGSLVLDWAGPAEALRIANQQLRTAGRSERFGIEFASPQPVSVGSVGITLSGLSPLPALRADAAARTIWLVLAGLPDDATATATATGSDEARTLLAWLRGLRLQRGRLELVTMGAGTLLAARAGLLAGRRATTHHQHLDELRALEPRCDLLANRLFVLDAPLYSSAGGSTGIDLMLHRIAETCGEALAAQVAQAMTVAPRRRPHDPELSPFLAYRNHLHAALHRVQDAVSSQPRADWSVPRMAELAPTTARHLTRLFVLHAGITPLAWLRRLRLASAQRALQAGASVTRAAELSGFGSDTQLRRAWRQFGLDGAPSTRHLLSKR